MELNRIKEAADKFGTPLYLFDLDCIRDRVQRFRDAFKGEIGLTYSMKTNPFLTLEMSRQVERIEVCSMGEFRICRDLAIPAHKLYISGVLKIREDLMEILEYGQDEARYTAESPFSSQCFLNGPTRTARPSGFIPDLLTEASSVWMKTRSAD